MKKLSLLCLSIGFFVALSSQSVAQDVLDGFYQKEVIPEKEIIPYDHVREADVFWSKRIFREIDVDEKMNLPFKYPKEPLIKIIHEAAKAGDLTVYDPVVEYAYDFTKEMPTDEVKGIGYREDTLFQVNPITLEEEVVYAKNELQWDQIIKYKIKEDWFFDENTSTFQVRIIGIAPLMDVTTSEGVKIGTAAMYWIYYPDLRPILAKYRVFNNQNDATTMSWEDLFEARIFASYITKESNVHDREIKNYATGIDALLESDRIKQEMFEFEHDLWTY